MKIIALAVIFGLVGCANPYEVVPASEVGKVRSSFVQSNTGQLIYNPSIKQYNTPHVKSVDEMLAEREEVRRNRQEMGLNEERDAYRNSPEITKEQKISEYCATIWTNWGINNRRSLREVEQKFEQCVNKLTNL